MTIKFVLEEGWRFLRHNPDIIYKGAPLLVAFYFVSPVITTTWAWLPWIWASYDIARRIPPEWVNGTYTSVKAYVIERTRELHTSGTK